MGKVLSEDDVRRIVEAAYRILERVGFVAESERVRSLLIEAGCRYNPSDGRIRMPREQRKSFWFSKPMSDRRTRHQKSPARTSIQNLLVQTAMVPSPPGAAQLCERCR